MWGSNNKDGRPQGSWNDLPNDAGVDDYFGDLKGIAEIQLAPNNAPTGDLVIDGELKIRESITIDTSNIVDLDNFDGYIPTFNYSWETSTDQGNSWSALTSTDATDNNDQLTLTEDESGLQIRGVVSYMDGYTWPGLRLGL